MQTLQFQNPSRTSNEARADAKLRGCLCQPCQSDSTVTVKNSSSCHAVAADICSCSFTCYANLSLYHSNSECAPVLSHPLGPSPIYPPPVRPPTLSPGRAHELDGKRSLNDPSMMSDLRHTLITISKVPATTQWVPGTAISVTFGSYQRHLKRCRPGLLARHLHVCTPRQKPG
jgi:hypothetical protein